jgi:copper chaperone CopZ
MKRIYAACAALFGLSACVTPYAPIPYDRTSAGVTKVTVIADAFPDEVMTQKLATNGQNMSSALAASAGLAGVLVGAVAAGVEAGIEAGQRKRIQEALATQNFDGEAIFDAALEAALQESGYETNSVDLKHAENRGFIVLKPNPGAEIGTGVLDIAGAGYGYQLVGGATQWRPFVSISVKMTDLVDPTKVLLENRVVYNPVATPDVIINIPPDAQYAFNKIEDIEADPAKAAKGLETALVASAQAVAQLLK